ncbi:hypothetical protein EfmJHP38_09920 [Enterococcus faecium]|nr:hypothetical protein EfmJHP38_09920 [Enterococcus faecium]
MRKYTFVFKKKVVSDYLNNEGGYKYLAHKYQINRTLVRHWVRIYNYHGWEGLVGGGKSYTTKFKLDVIEYMETNGLSIQETAKKFNIGSNRTLSKWIEQYEEGGASSLAMLFPSVWLSDAFALGKYHTGSNLCLWKACIGLAEILKP